MSTRYLENLFNPDSIVVIGASERADSLGGMVLRNLMGGEYAGRLLVVNRNDYDNVHGVPCVRKVSRMDFSPDLAIVCTPPDTVARTIRRLGEAGVRTAIVMTGGMSRTHSKTGQPLMYAVREAARETGVRVLGPNTIGLMVPKRNLNATYAHMGVIPGRVAFIGQSGTIASSVIDWAFARGVGFSYFLTLGDGMDIDHDDLIDYLAQDAQTRAILLHIENVPNPSRFMSAVRAASRTKPVIAVKSGRVPESEWVPHVLPAGVTRSDPIYDAMLQRAGVLRVDGLGQMFDALETLTRMRPLRREGLVIMANGVGPGVLAVDRLDHLEGELARLSDQTVKALAGLLPSYWTRRNPIDLNYDASPELYSRVIQILARDPEVANVLVMYSPSLTEDNLQIADAVIHAAKGTRLNVFTCWLGQSTVMDSREEFYRAGLPSFFSPEKAVTAFMQHIRHQRVQRLLTETPESFTDHFIDRSVTRRVVRHALSAGRYHLSNREARDLIADYGISTIETMYCDDMDEVLELFAVERRPVDVTIIHEQVCHPFLNLSPTQRRYKGTIQKLNSEQAIIEACRFLMEDYQFHFPKSGFLGFAVQRSYQHVGGIEFSVGITRDPVFGPLVVCGAAGAQINIMTDRQIALPPLNMVLARELLRRTYMYKLLKEHSLKPDEDIRAVTETLVTLSQIVIDIPEIKGLEISPLLFNEQGAVAVNIAVNLSDHAGKPIIQPYPRELEEWIVLPKSGRRVIIRPVLAEDEPAHRVFHERQSPESIRYRFFQYRKHFSREDVAQMVQIDYDREMVFIANAPREDGEGEETLGTVRTWTDADNLQCEFAVMVHDKMKGEGLGVTLMHKMIDYCRARGTVEMVGNVLPDNRPMLSLAEHLGFEVKYNLEEEVMDLRLVLNEPQKEWQRERLGKDT
ncbi:bifunctional acetate--CoA ligase family protein/GNAT family N-acetyltransferase [Marinobacter salinisoli]|uniref:Bifunctional acetate--CoA ligase family protein/GNAT family N-acetyltransferase n=1 Tax=Marinobacter salinisoli TaxID=2769486 RepID=A0ABX7MPQ5_9GAMM|nr:bifunctional acetate--CoA ligase family protein/GNAT family N-acetyltransferase [Marinobacter salinisoli]QSP94297.1 bifunctional acetate--CoA ligase family protein/GNAT family N-acetyltransferase [Marinobacter salinisoli]